MKAALSVLLVGCLPPPVGGVSVHLERLQARLREQGHHVRVADDAPVPPLLLPFWILGKLLRLRIAPRAVVHVHSGNWRTRFLAAGLGRLMRLPVVVTVHSFRPSDNPRTLRLAAGTLRLAQRLIVTNPEIRERCIAHGAVPERIRIQHAYLDPQLQANPLPTEVQDFLDSHRPLIAASAFRLRFHEGVDLYGLDLLIEMMPGLAHHHPEAGLIFVLPEPGLPGYLESCRVRIRELNLEARFLIVMQGLDFTSLLRRCDLLIRPTTTDGDSLGIREALFVGCRVLASDAAPRPPQCMLFRSRDGVNLLARTLEALAAQPPQQVRGQDGLEGVLSAYRDARHG